MPTLIDIPLTLTMAINKLVFGIIITYKILHLIKACRNLVKEKLFVFVTVKASIGPDHPYETYTINLISFKVEAEIKVKNLLFSSNRFVDDILSLNIQTFQ